MSLAMEDKAALSMYTPTVYEQGVSEADLLAIALAYHDIALSDEQREEAKTIIRGLVDKWLETLSPLPYIEGLAGDVYRAVSGKKLWEAGIDEDTLTHIIVDTVLFKEEADKGAPEPILEALAIVLSIRVKEFFEKVAGEAIVSDKYPVLASIIEHGGEPDEWIRKLSASAALALVMMTNT